MRFMRLSILAALAALLVGCAALGAIVSRRVEQDGFTFVVIETYEILSGEIDDDDGSSVTSQQVYQVTPDGRYRRLGAWYPSSSENYGSGQAGVGVYSEADRALVTNVLTHVNDSRENYVTTLDGRNAADIDTAVRMVTGEAPRLVDSPGRLIFPGAPAAVPTPAPVPDLGGGIDDTQGE